MDSKKQERINLSVKRVPDVCYDCAAVINPGGAVMLGESGQIICKKCLDLVLDGATAKPADREMAR